jgi:DNA-binding CsgD family transcriptional regulator
MRFLAADGHVGALLLAGRITDAQAAAERLAGRAADLPSAGQRHTDPVLGRAALGAGRLDRARGLLEPVADALFAAGDANGWGYRCQIPLTTALAMAGLTDEARAAVVVLEQTRHPVWRYLHYEHAMAQAWVAACRGAVTEAIATVRAAAETARANGQFGAEVMCLQTATQFGDRSCAARLRELASIVEGPRAELAARFAEAIGNGNAGELEAVSSDFEKMGDRVAAIDAAAHAALAYRKQHLRGSAVRCSARAETLAAESGDASTPALRQVIEPLPLSDREREVVMLIGEDLSSREIAERLTLSVRTVEGHIYRAMARTGVASRDELAALLPRRSSRGEQ